MHPEAERVLQQLGGDSSRFAARQLTPKIALDADLILTMSRTHRDAVLELAPRQLHNTFTLSGVAHLASELGARSVDDLAELRPHLPTSAEFDVPDPIGRDAAFHAVVGSQIAALLPPVLALLRR